MTSAAAGLMTVERIDGPRRSRRTSTGRSTIFSRRSPTPDSLSAEERRGIIARYTAVLEGNFIYWMTGAYISVGSDEARAKIMDNLREEVRDCHPGHDAAVRHRGPAPFRPMPMRRPSIAT